MSAVRRADAVARWWVHRYTSALPPEVAQRRRDEVSSDLWEQQAWASARGTSTTAVAVSIARRVVAGVPADLWWRRSQLAPVAATAPGPVAVLWSRVRRSWWLALALVLGTLQLVGGVIAPFETPPGDATVVVVNTAAGLAVIGGLAVRRGRRVPGDLMIAAGVVPLVSTFWTYVLPIAAVAVVAASVVDAAEAGAPATGSGVGVDRGHRVLVAALIAATVAAVAIGGADRAVVLVSPVLAALLTHAVVSRRADLALASRTRTGLLMIGTGLGGGALTLLAVLVSAADGITLSHGAALVAAAVTAGGTALGTVLLVIDARTSSG